jgi:hypothetical protein
VKCAIPRLWGLPLPTLLRCERYRTLFDRDLTTLATCPQILWPRGSSPCAPFAISPVDLTTDLCTNEDGRAAHGGCYAQGISDLPLRDNLSSQAKPGNP